MFMFALYEFIFFTQKIKKYSRGRHGHDRMVVGFATGRWFSPGPPVFSTNKTDRHDITEILLKVVLNTINQTNKQKINRK